MNCASLQSMHLPGSVQTLGTFVFDYCRSLRTFAIEHNSRLADIDGLQFFNCPSLNSFWVPASFPLDNDSVLSLYGIVDKCFVHIQEKSLKRLRGMMDREIGEGDKLREVSMELARERETFNQLKAALQSLQKH
jgi:hypothetical protein